MKWVKWILLLFGTLIAVGSIVAGVIERFHQIQAEKKARAEDKKIHVPCGPYEKYFKRPLDFALSSFALIVLSPVLLVTSLAVRIKLGSPIVFSQPRPGKDEKIFRLTKFRSLTNEKDSEGNLLPDEQRMTPFGSWLRSTSLDELLELFCIQAGSMSIVGPRPLLVQYLDRYTPEQRRRQEVRPGLTGLAQVNGRNAATWEEKFTWDIKYVDRITFLGDIKIILKTFKVVLSHEGITGENSATMTEFMKTVE